MKKKEKEFGYQLVEAFSGALEALCKDEQKKWLESVAPGELVITMKVRDFDNEIEAIRHVFTFDQIKGPKYKLFQVAFEEMLDKIATAKILKKVLLDLPDTPVTGGEK